MATWWIVIIGLVLLFAPSNAHALTPPEAVTMVTALYAELLQRAPDPVGLHGWSDFLLAGGTVAQLRAAILASAEYQALHAPRPSVNNLQPPSTSGLQSTPVFNTAPFPCDGQHRTLTAFNVSGGAARLRMIRSWHGMDFGRMADYGSVITRLSDGIPVQPYPEDHYTQPVGSGLMDTLTFPEPGILLQPNDGLVLDYACIPQGQYDFIRGHVGVFVWWTWGP